MLEATDGGGLHASGKKDNLERDAIISSEVRLPALKISQTHKSLSTSVILLLPVSYSPHV